MKPVSETKVGKFLKSKGFNDVLDIAGGFVPGIKVFDMIKDAVLGENAEVKLTAEEKAQFLEMLNIELLEFGKEVEDRMDARNRETEQLKAGKKIDWMMVTTGLTGLGLLMYIAYVIVYVNIPTDKLNIFHHFIGLIEGIVVSIFTYYFGSSKGSRDKTTLLKKAG
jgi:hypothetical protein